MMWYSGSLQTSFLRLGGPPAALLLDTLHRLGSKRAELWAKDSLHQRQDQPLVPCRAPYTLEVSPHLLPV